jgi:hypothetical protein
MKMTALSATSLVVQVEICSSKSKVVSGQRRERESSPSYPTRKQWREYLEAVGLTDVGVGDSEYRFLRDEPSRRYADTEGEAEGPAELPEEGSPQEAERVILKEEEIEKEGSERLILGEEEIQEEEVTEEGSDDDTDATSNPRSHQSCHHLHQALFFPARRNINCRHTKVLQFHLMRHL